MLKTAISFINKLKSKNISDNSALYVSWTCFVWCQIEDICRHNNKILKIELRKIWTPYKAFKFFENNCEKKSLELETEDSVLKKMLWKASFKIMYWILNKIKFSEGLQYGIK